MSMDFTYDVAKQISASVSLELKGSRVLKSTQQSSAWFDRDEIQIGNLLGSGGFANVYEIKGFACKNTAYSPEEKSRRNRVVEEMTTTTTRKKKRDKTKSPSSRYVVKTIRPSKQVVGPDGNFDRFVDAGHGLVMEAHFLSVLQHPHILSVRGLPSQGCMAFRQGFDGFFILFDRLESTLDERIVEWSKQMAQYKTSVMERINQPGMKGLLFTGRLKVARDVASALAYLHENHVVYRDLKPANIGFDMEGKVKLFDFGLARELPRALSSRGTTEEVFFHMTAQVGTPRYMSPEVSNGAPYNEKTDVYSLSLVMWEILALVRPFCEWSKQDEIRKFVCQDGERPNMEESWPEEIKAVMKLAWDADPRQRPTMAEVKRALDGECRLLRRNSLPVGMKLSSRALMQMSTTTTMGSSRRSLTPTERQRHQ